jgi:hypothetical protein
MEPETPEAKLRNQLTPLYGLADMVLLLESKPEILPILLETAKKSISSKVEIDRLLLEIEYKPTCMNPFIPPKFCDCKRQFDSSAKMRCDGNCH